MAKEQKKEPLHVRDFENMDDDAILQQVLTDLRVSEAFQSPYFDKFRRFYKLYKSYISDTDKKAGRSNLFIPYTFSQIETIVPKKILGMFSSRPYVQTMPLGIDTNNTREERAKKMNKLLDYQFQQRIKFINIVTDVVKAMEIYGTAITKQTWNFEVKKVVKRQQNQILGIAIPGTYKNVLVESVVKDDPKVTLIPILDFFFDPAGSDIESGRYAIHRYWEDYHELEEKNRKNKGVYKNLDKLKGEQSSNTNESSDMITEVGISASPNSKKGIEIHEYWTDDWVIKVANKSVVIYSQMNPFFHHRKPFSRWVSASIPNEFYGIGAVESIEPLQNELNTTRNQRLDNVSFVLNKMFAVRRGSNIDPNQLISRPGGFVEVDEMDDIKELDFKDVTASSYNEEVYIKQDIDRSTGIHDTERGSTPQRRETATTMNILANAGSERFKLSVMLMEYDGLHDMVNQIVMLNQQYIDRPKEILLLGEDGVTTVDTITPEEIMGQYTLVAVGSAVEPRVNKEQYQAQITQLYAAVQNSPEVNRAELLKIMFDAFDIKDSTKLIIQQQALPPEMQQLIGANISQNPLQMQNSEV